MAALQHSQKLKVELQKAENSHRPGLYNEAKAFAQQKIQEVAHHANSSSQAQSLLSAERQQHDKDPSAQAERWQQWMWWHRGQKKSSTSRRKSAKS